MGKIDEIRDLRLVENELMNLSVDELVCEKERWEEMICNDDVESPCQKSRLRILRAISKELEARR